ncbi:zf-HC2 domain-containing protein [Saccharopolyspora griseoalba]|uniref:Zf-HC2 domain-containing protein n=1 Tax=Saccharopolyspora griseoalba TaxID=1431848 RepID=A0ABW2LP98_9PSEU
MTALRGWGLPEQHLALDAIVAFVDGELSASAHDRAVAHLAHCPACSAEATTQRQARAAVKEAEVPSVSPALLQALQAIPGTAELPGAPEGLALSEDGQLVTTTRSERAEKLGGGSRLGSSTPLGGARPLGVGPFETADEASRRAGRRTKQGAGVVFSGLVLGALAFMNLPDDEGRPVTPVPLPGDDFSNAVLPAAGHTVLPEESSSAARPAGSPAPETAPAPSSAATSTAVGEPTAPEPSVTESAEATASATPAN